jgi:GTPase SAR1 family protein
MTKVEIHYKRVVEIVCVDNAESVPEEGTHVAALIGHRVKIAGLQGDYSRYNDCYGIVEQRNFNKGTFVVELEDHTVIHVQLENLLPDLRDDKWMVQELPRDCLLAEDGLVLDGLTGLTQYNIRLRYCCDAGTSDFSEVLLIKTTRPAETEPYNVFLCGPTGVGKSTFINAFQNYLQFATLDEAKGNLQACMPAQFSVFDKNTGKETVVKVGPPSAMGEELTGKEQFEEETGKKGESCTQFCNPYLFNITNSARPFSVRILDTPGTGDTRGALVDASNLQHILDTFAVYRKIHAIIFLLKANEMKNTASFEYCIMSLLKNLHANAARNIFFVMTNARSTFYAPGGTMTPLNAVLEDIRKRGKVDIQANICAPDQTVFCIDSESFRYLAALQQGVSLPGAEDSDFAQAWERSVETVKAIMQRIKTLPPHVSAETAGLNKARELILVMREPLVEILKTIERSVNNQVTRQQLIASSEHTLHSLEAELTFKSSVLKTHRLSYPRTVCTHNNCCQIEQDAEGTQRKVFKQACHHQCSIKAPEASYPEPCLQGCYAMRGAGQSTSAATCAECGHGWALHMHTMVEYTHEEKTFENLTVRKQFDDAKTNKDKMEVLLADAEQILSEMKEERKIISQTSATFSVFLAHCGLAPINNAFIPYIEVQIDRETDFLNQPLITEEMKESRQKVLDGLLKAKEMHELEVADISAAMKEQTSELPTPESIKDKQQALFALKHFGKQIRDACQVKVSASSASRDMRDQVYGQPERAMRRERASKGKGKGKPHAGGLGLVEAFSNGVRFVRSLW